MPRVSEKRQVLARVEPLVLESLRIVYLRELTGTKDRIADSIAYALCKYYLEATALRYWQERRYEKMNWQTLISILYDTNEQPFRVHFRMGRPKFQQLCSLIRNHQVFVPVGRKPQAPLEVQLLVCLKRLGCNGNAMGAHSINRMFCIGGGTVHLYTERCLTALLELQHRFLRWPNSEERSNMARTIEVRNIMFKADFK